MNNCAGCLYRIFAVSDLAKRCAKCPAERENAAKLTAAELEPDAIFVLPEREFIEPELVREIDGIIRGR